MTFLEKLTTDEEVRHIREAFASGMSTPEIADALGFRTPYISQIIYGHTRKRAGGPIADRPGQDSNHKKLTLEEALMVRQAYATGKFTQGELADICGVERCTISFIVNGTTYKHAGGPIKGQDY